MERCPKCGKFTLDYASYLNEAKCLNLSCDFEESVIDEKDYRRKYDPNSENYDRKKPKWDIRFDIKE